MIIQLSGAVVEKGPRFAIIDVSGVGYKVFAPKDTLTSFQNGEKVKVWTYHAVREDAEDLYGFLDKENLNFFELLITISGIGPKTALGILDIATLPTIKKAVLTDDPSYLTKVSGVGKKVAEKIVRELKDKMEVGEGETEHAAIHEDDSLEALMSIGYSERDAREALKKVPTSVTGAAERVRAAIKILGKK